MSFISLIFPIFLVIVVLVYFALPLRLRWLWLLLASYFFYAQSTSYYVFLIAFSTLVDYVAAREIARTDLDNTRKRKLLLGISILVNLGFLFVFKYFNFFSNSGALFFNSIGLNYGAFTHQLILPVGISFYTFQSMSYTIDVYRGDIKPEGNAGVFATYVAFFPQLVAGPIERASNILPQFSKATSFEYARVVLGLQLILWGVFKKAVIADRLAVYVNAVYNDVDSYSGLPLVVATVFFAIQIYCDFSGYSDIAVGAARILGFDLMENFKRPYFSRSVREFWRRWHISLSTWFRDYLYIPLGGNRKSYGRTLFNLMVVFVVSGLWHGANWTFVIWGALHGIFVVIETILARWQLTPKKSDRLVVKLGQIIFTCVLVGFAWIFFRANTLGDALYIIQNLFVSLDTSTLLVPLFGTQFDPRVGFVVSCLAIGILFGIEIVSPAYRQKLWNQSRVVRWLVYYSAITVIVYSLLSINTDQPFIYFQF